MSFNPKENPNAYLNTPTQQTVSGGYSERNKVPTIAGYEAQQKELQEQAVAAAVSRAEHSKSAPSPPNQMSDTDSHHKSSILRPSSIFKKIKDQSNSKTSSGGDNVAVDNTAATKQASILEAAEERAENVETIQPHEYTEKTEKAETNEKMAGDDVNDSDIKKGWGYSNKEETKELSAKEEMMKTINAGGKVRALDFKPQGDHDVLDPVTQQMVTIKDAELKDASKSPYYTKAPKHAHAKEEKKNGLNPLKAVGKGVGAVGKGVTKGFGNLVGVNKPGIHEDEVSNILVHPFPPPIEQVSLKNMNGILQYNASIIVGAIGVVWLLVIFLGNHGWLGFIWKSGLFISLAVVVWSAQGILARKIEKEMQRIRLDLLKQRAEAYSPPTPESVEWLNSFIYTVWPLINPAMFASVVDMIEDVMQASLPGFVDAVKIDNFTLGHNALRIVQIRALPDQPGMKGYPKEEWIDQGTTDPAISLDPKKRARLELEKAQQKATAEVSVLHNEGAVSTVPAKTGLSTQEEERKVQLEKLAAGEENVSVKPLKETDKVYTKDQEEDEAEPDFDQAGDYVNLEISFAYTAQPGEKVQDENISLFIQFFVGMYDWFRTPVPLWIAVENIVGTVRLRLQMVQQPPFIRNCTITLMGTPLVEASAIPLTSALPNVLDLPLVSSFVQKSIAAATSAYVAPKSMMLNLAEILMGDGVKKEVNSLGVLKVTIHYAEGLSAQDTNGFSDPYVVLAYAKFGKPLFSTRILSKTLNPSWEQTAFIMVDNDEVRAKELLSVQLWDKDDIGADDLVGRIEVPIIDLMLSPGKVHDRTDSLMGFEDADVMAGCLFWSVAYYDKMPINQERSREANIDHSLPPELQNRPELKIKEYAQNTKENAVLFTPPDPEHPSGILSVVIHHINNLENKNLNGAIVEDAEGEAGQDTGEGDNVAGQIPSSYCEIVVNDSLIYKTRVKQYSSMPFFEAGTETFIENWQDTTVRVAVRDSRVREHDPILGIVNLPLKDIMQSGSQVTRFYALQDGVGYGRARISCLFRSVDIHLEKKEQGWETGSVLITAPIKVTPVPGADFNWKEKKLVLSSAGGSHKFSKDDANMEADGSLTYMIERDLRIATYNRHSSALFFDYGGGISIGSLGNKMDAFAALWLTELVDHEPTDVRIPVVVNKGKSEIRQVVLNDWTKNYYEYDIVGYLTTTVAFDPGLDLAHEIYATTNLRRHEYEIYDRIEGQALVSELKARLDAGEVIDPNDQQTIKRAHKKALESRHRGKMQNKSVRTAVWAADGLKSRVKRILPGKKVKDEEIATEA